VVTELLVTILSLRSVICNKVIVICKRLQHILNALLHYLTSIIGSGMFNHYFSLGSWISILRIDPYLISYKVMKLGGLLFWITLYIHTLYSSLINKFSSYLLLKHFHWNRGVGTCRSLTDVRRGQHDSRWIVFSRQLFPLHHYTRTIAIIIIIIISSSSSSSSSKQLAG